MKQAHKKTMLITIAAVLVLAAASLVLAYLTPLRDPLTVFFKRAYPQALVGSRVVSINDVEQAVLVAKKYGIAEREAKDQYMAYEKSEALARSMNLSAKGDDAADEFRFYTKGNESEYRDLLRQNYGNSEYLFYKYLIYPQVTDAHLRIKYHNDIRSASPAFKEAQAALERLKKGEKFEDLAKAMSDDKASAQIGGDLGFYESGQLLPELEDQISISALGEVREDIISTRLGYHIIYPLEQSTTDGKKLWHAKHMLFVPDGYEAWLAQKAAGINVRTIKK
jgi:parvulin-like peptidyl-prolyl isomerase